MDLQDGDVIHMNSKQSLWNGSASRISEIKQQIKARFNDRPNWIGDEGTECELLQEGGKWRKGRIRLRLEFVPDKEESPLDELRSDLHI